MTMFRAVGGAIVPMTDEEVSARMVEELAWQANTIVPQAVTMRQARLALLGAGLLSTVNSAILSMTGSQGDTARIEWEFSNEVRRNQPLVASLGAAIGMTSEQLDALFITAATL